MFSKRNETQRRCLTPGSRSAQSISAAAPRCLHFFFHSFFAAHSSTRRGARVALKVAFCFNYKAFVRNCRGTVGSPSAANERLFFNAFFLSTIVESKRSISHWNCRCMSTSISLEKRSTVPDRILSLLWSSLGKVNLTLHVLNYHGVFGVCVVQVRCGVELILLSPTKNSNKYQYNWNKI